MNADKEEAKAKETPDGPQQAHPFFREDLMGMLLLAAVLATLTMAAACAGADVSTSRADDGQPPAHRHANARRAVAGSQGGRAEEDRRTRLTGGLHSHVDQLGRRAADRAAAHSGHRGLRPYGAGGAGLLAAGQGTADVHAGDQAGGPVVPGGLLRHGPSPAGWGGGADARGTGLCRVRGGRLGRQAGLDGEARGHRAGAAVAAGGGCGRPAGPAAAGGAGRRGCTRRERHAGGVELAAGFVGRRIRRGRGAPGRAA